MTGDPLSERRGTVGSRFSAERDVRRFIIISPVVPVESIGRTTVTREEIASPVAAAVEQQRRMVDEIARNGHHAIQATQDVSFNIVWILGDVTKNRIFFKNNAIYAGYFRSL